VKALVTGASGFIGSHLVRRLVTDGHDVRTYGRSASTPSQFAELAVEHFSGDITDPDAIARAVSGREVVFHMAGLVSYRRSDREMQRRVNVDGTRNVMESALKAGVARVIFTGSIAGMGIPERGAIGTEEIAYNLAGRGLNYCDTKHAAEEEVHCWIRQGLPALILNPGIIFGEGDTHPHHHVIFSILSKGWLLGVPVGGVSFCDVRDVVGAHVNAITMGRTGERYVLASENLTYRDAAAIVSRTLGTTQPRFEIPGWILETAAAACETVMPVFGARPSLTGQVAWLSQQRIFFSSRKAVDEIGYETTPFAQTIDRTAMYYLDGKAGHK